MFTGYRTIIFNVVMMLLTLTKAVFPDFVLPEQELIVNGIDGSLMLMGLIWGAGGIWLRMRTKAPVPPMKKPDDGGYDANGSPLPALFILPFIGLLLVLSGCTGLKAAYSGAKTVEQQAYVVTEHYAAVLKEAVRLRNAGLPADKVTAIQRADKVAGPLVYTLGQAAQAYEASKTADNEKALTEALNKAVLALSDFINVVKEVQK